MQYVYIFMCIYVSACVILLLRSHINKNRYCNCPSFGELNDPLCLSQTTRALCYSDVSFQAAPEICILRNIADPSSVTAHEKQPNPPGRAFPPWLWAQSPGLCHATDGPPLGEKEIGITFYTCVKLM